METLQINGRDKEFPDGLPATVADLLVQMEISPATVLVQLEGQTVKREDFTETELSPGQSLEVLRILGGG